MTRTLAPIPSRFDSVPTVFTRSGQSFLLSYTAGADFNDLVIQRASTAQAPAAMLAALKADSSVIEADVVGQDRSEARLQLRPQGGVVPSLHDGVVPSLHSGVVPSLAGMSNPARRLDNFFAMFEDAMASALDMAEALSDQPLS